MKMVSYSWIYVSEVAVMVKALQAGVENLTPQKRQTDCKHIHRPIPRVGYGNKRMGMYRLAFNSLQSRC